MLRTRLMTATAAVALFAAGSAFAQDAATPAPAQEMAPAQAAPAQATTPAATNTVVDVLRANGQFTTLLSALDAAQLTDTLSSQPAVSIFAPTDAAFAALPEDERTRLMDPANVNELRQLLLYHVVVADVNSSQIEGARGGVQTAATTEVQLDGTGDAIKVDAATVTQADIDASNGAIFAIDRVLNPAESQVAAGDGEEAAVPADSAPAATETPPVAAPVEGAPAPVESTAPDTATMEAPATDDVMTDDAMTPPTAATTTTTESSTTLNAPNGQPAESVTTTASPPVPNPTDGQVDGEATDNVTPADPQS